MDGERLRPFGGSSYAGLIALVCDFVRLRAESRAESGLET